VLKGLGMDEVFWEIFYVPKLKVKGLTDRVYFSCEYEGMMNKTDMKSRNNEYMITENYVTNLAT
jgi:hypothetical protein